MQLTVSAAVDLVCEEKALTAPPWMYPAGLDDVSGGLSVGESLPTADSVLLRLLADGGDPRQHRPQPSPLFRRRLVQRPRAEQAAEGLELCVGTAACPSAGGGAGGGLPHGQGRASRPRSSPGTGAGAVGRATPTPSGPLAGLLGVAGDTEAFSASGRSANTSAMTPVEDSSEKLTRWGWYFGNGKFVGLQKGMRLAVTGRAAGEPIGEQVRIEEVDKKHVRLTSCTSGRRWRCTADEMLDFYGMTRVDDVPLPERRRLTEKEVAHIPLLRQMLAEGSAEQVPFEHPNSVDSGYTPAAPLLEESGTLEDSIVLAEESFEESGTSAEDTSFMAKYTSEWSKAALAAMLLDLDPSQDAGEQRGPSAAPQNVTKDVDAGAKELVCCAMGLQRGWSTAEGVAGQRGGQARLVARPHTSLGRRPQTSRATPVPEDVEDLCLGSLRPQRILYSAAAPREADGGSSRPATSLGFAPRPGCLSPTGERRAPPLTRSPGPPSRAPSRQGGGGEAPVKWPGAGFSLSALLPH